MFPDDPASPAALLEAYGETARFAGRMLGAGSPEESEAVLGFSTPPPAEELLSLFEVAGFLQDDLDGGTLRRLCWTLLIPLLRSDDTAWTELGAILAAPFLKPPFRISEQVWLAQLVAPVCFDLSEKGQPEEAARGLGILRLATEAIDLFPEDERDAVRWSVARLRGLLALRTGDLTEAEPAAVLYDEAVEALVPAARHLNDLGTHIHLGKAYEARCAPGDLDRAVAAYRAGLALKARPRDSERVATAWRGIARCLPEDDLAGRRAALGRAWVHAAALDPAARLSLATQYAFTLSQGSGRQVRLDRAVAVLSGGIAGVEGETVEPDGATALQWGVLASWYDTLGRSDEADRAMHRSLLGLNDWKEAFYGEPVQGEQRLAEIYAGFYPRVIDYLIDKGRVVEAYDLAAVLQAHLLTDMLSHRGRAPGRADDDALWSEALQAREAAIAGKGGRDAGRLEDAFQKLLAEMRRRDPGAASVLGQERPGWRLLAGRLGHDQALLLIAPTYRRLLVFLIRNPVSGPKIDGMTVGSSGLADVARVILDWIADYEEYRWDGSAAPERMARVQASLSRACAWVADALELARVIRRLRGIRRIVLVPLWPLTFLPVPLIRDTRGRSLGERFDVTVLPNPTWTVVDRREPIGPASPATAVIDSRPLDAPLPFSHLEAAGLALAFPNVTLRAGNGADRAALIEALERDRLVHIACHAQHSFKGFGRVLLANGESLAFSEVGKLAVRADLVVLSACESGLSSVETLRHEIFSLPTTLIAAGANSVLGTLWQVEDRAAGLLMAEFYRRLAEGSPAAAALAGAQRWLAGASGATLADMAEKLAAAEPSGRGGDLIRRWVTRLRRPDRAPAKPYSAPFYWQSFYVLGT